MTLLLLSVLAIAAIALFLAVGRAIAVARFEREMRAIALPDDRRLLGVPPISMKPDHSSR